MNMSETLDKSMQEVMQYAKGDSSKVSVEPYQIQDAPHFHAKEIKHIREQIPATQRVLAHYLSVSPRTVESWEADRTEPNGSSRRLLQLIEKDPKLIMEFSK
ncbi:XRE family transcriptional regulator [Oenococcus oeni IOEB_S436a]|nr:XRE family transcriptional regulator [Oenococcus oeni]KGH86609.1 XRE family transcriptional regulator [Oenococcus oeni IOEB_VF]KGH96010.1 XRE family transcriptional regulator [Oenococcus oeni IOEB_S436a]KGI02473.1 XRE family transcriptional regulator [Oenococcus oeni IOEB_C52]KER94555.1 XRE family transcriptional regulator [Oenococcus oeni]